MGGGEGKKEERGGEGDFPERIWVMGRLGRRWVRFGGVDQVMEDEMREKRANLTRGIWHSSDDFCSWRHHCYQLSDCDSRKYADQELSI